MEQDRMVELEERVKSLEVERDRFLSALKQAVGSMMKNPMALAMMPKEMKQDLQKYLEN